MLITWLELQVQPIAVASLVSIGFFLMVFVTASLFGKKVHREHHHGEYQTEWSLYLFHCVFAIAAVLIVISTMEDHWGHEDVGFGFVASWSILALMVSGALSSQPWRYLRWIIPPQGFPRPIWFLSLAAGAITVTSSVVFLNGQLSLVQTQPGEIVVSLVSEEESKDALGRSLLSDAITIRVEPYFDDVTIGSSVPFAVTVANGTEHAINKLTLSPISSDSVWFEENVSWGWDRLEPRNTWGPKITSALFTAPGVQAVEFELRYINDATPNVDKAIGSWSGKVGAPKLHVERKIFAPETLKTGETIEVSLTVRNTGQSTATAVDYQPNLGQFFEILEWSKLASSIPEGESIRRFLVARAVEAGEFTVRPPAITFSDSSGTDYTNFPEYNVDYSDLLCDQGEQCSQLTRIRIHPAEVPTSPSTYIALPPVISYNPGTITIQLAPGDKQTTALNISHDSNRELRVVASTSTSIKPVEIQVPETTVISPGEAQRIPISIYSPPTTPYGHYQSTLQLEVVDPLRPAGNQIYSVPITVDVTPVLIRHDLTISHLAVGQQSMINTVITNVRNERATVQIDIYFPDGGLSVVSSQLEPVGNVRGTTGQVYSQVLELDPTKIKSHQRTVVVQIGDDTPLTKRIVGVIRYKFDDGLSGSLTSETYIHVIDP